MKKVLDNVMEMVAAVLLMVFAVMFALSLMVWSLLEAWLERRKEARR